MANQVALKPLRSVSFSGSGTNAALRERPEERAQPGGPGVPGRSQQVWNLPERGGTISRGAGRSGASRPAAKSSVRETWAGRTLGGQTDLQRASSSQFQTPLPLLERTWAATGGELPSIIILQL